MFLEFVEICVQGVFRLGQFPAIETCFGGSGIRDAWRTFDDVRPA